MTRNIYLLLLMVGVTLFPEISTGQSYRLSKISGTREGRQEVYSYYYSDHLLDSITIRYDDQWTMKEIAYYDDNNTLIKVDECQYSTYSNQWYLATCYDYRYDKDGLLKSFTKSVYYDTEAYPLEDYEYSYDSEGRRISVEVYDYTNDMILSQSNYSYNDQGELTRESVYKILSSDGLVEASRRDYSYTDKGQLIEVKCYIRQDNDLLHDKTLRYLYDDDGACLSVEHYAIGIEYPIIIYQYRSDKRSLQADCASYLFPQSYFPELPIDQYARLNEQILLIDSNQKQTEHANYTYSYEQINTPTSDYIACWNTTLQVAQKGYIGIASTSDFEIDWGDGIYVSYPAGDYAAVSKRKEGTIKGSQIRIKGDPSAITKLNLAQQGVTDIDLKGLTALTELYLTENGLTSIDLSCQPALQQLYVDKNSLGAIDLSAQKNLTLLRANNNKLTKIDVSNNLLLNELILSENQLTDLEVQLLIDLEELQVDYNNLTELDVTQNRKLTDLDLDFNRLEFIDLQYNDNITWLYLEGNKISSIDLSSLISLRNLNLRGNALTSIDLSHNTDLVELILSDNNIGHLDLSLHNSISRLYVSNCALNDLDVTQLIQLSTLEADQNKLKTIDLTACDRLKNLYLSSNMLSTIDLSNNPKLTKLYLDNNLFAQLDLKGLTKLTIVSIHHNLLEADELNNLYEALPDLSAIAVDPDITDHKTLKVYRNPGVDSSQHIIATEKGWIVDTKDPVGIDLTANTELANFILYPNPASEYICIERAKADTPIALYTIDGVLLLSTDTDAEGTGRLMVGHLPSGYYFVKISQELLNVIVIH